MPLRTVIEPRHRLKLHAGQAAVLRHPARYKCVVAGRRWGKSRCAQTALIQAASAAKNQLVWYVAPTYKMAKGIMWRELLTTVPRRWIRKINETELTMQLVNGSWIECKGADKPDSLRGVGLNYLIIDEAQDIKEETWELVLLPTLLTTRGRAMIIGTPKSYNWLHDKFLMGQRGDIYRDKKGRKVRNPWQSWQFQTVNSPFVSKSEIEAKRAEMDPKSFSQEFEASFVSMSGRVYYAFERSIHAGNYAFNNSLPVWIGMDFNINPMTAVIMQPQDNGDIWIVGELSLPDSNTDEVGDQLAQKFFRHMRMKMVSVFPDPAGINRNHATGQSDIDILREKGFRQILHRKKHPAVKDRVNATNRMFRSGDGRIRCYVDRTCTKTIEALEQTVYKPKTSIVDKSAGVEHPADAIGYCFDYKFPIRKIEIAGLSI